MSLFTPFTTQDEGSDAYSMLEGSGCNSPLYKKENLVISEDHEKYYIVPEEVICPKCYNNYMEPYQLASRQYVLMCGGKKETSTCIYPLDSEDITNFIGDSIQDLQQQASLLLKIKALPKEFN